MDFLATPHLWVLYEAPSPFLDHTDIHSVHRLLFLSKQWPGKFLMGAISLLLLGPEAPADAASTAYIAPPPGYNVNIRSGPGTQFAAVNTLARGTAIAMTGESANGWVQLTGNRWVAGNLIDGVPPAGTTLTYAAFIAPPAGYRANIRSGPGTQFAAVDTLLAGTAITVTGQSANGWARLAEDRWVAQNLIQIDRPIAQATPPAATPTPPNAPTDTSSGPLRLGSQGTAVIDLQERLQTLGYLPTDASLTDRFEVSTEQAVRAFQQRNRLTVDGIAGTRTLEILYSDTAIAAAPPSQPTGFLARGSEGPAVADLQTRLQALGYFPADVTPTETFGDLTEQGIRAFQIRNQLPIDGVAGPQTLDILYSEMAIANTPTAPVPAATPTPPPVTPTPALTPVPETPAPAPANSPTPPPAQETPAASPDSSIQERIIATDDGMDALVFSGPGTENDLRGFIPNGDIVRVTNTESGNWVQLENGSWIYADWLQPVE